VPPSSIVPNLPPIHKHHNVYLQWLNRARPRPALHRRDKSNLQAPRKQRPARLSPYLRCHELRRPSMATLGHRRRESVASPQSSLRPWPQHLGHSQCIQQRRQRGDHRQSDQEVRDPEEQDRHLEQVLRLRWRRARHQRNPVRAGHRQVQRLREPRW
jgi:hypothetical protein